MADSKARKCVTKHCWHKITKEPRKNKKCYPEDFYCDATEFEKGAFIKECCQCGQSVF